MNIFSLYLYSISLLLTLLIYQKKKKCFDAGSLLISAYCVSSFCSIIYYNDILYIHNEGNYFFPLVYLFIMLIISLKPIMNFDNQERLLILPKRIIIEGFSWLFIISTFLGSLFSDNSVFDGLILLMIDESAGLEMYQGMLDNAATAGSGISNLPTIISNAMYSVAVLLAFINLTYIKKKKFLICCIFCALLWSALKYVSIGERGGLVNRMLQIVVTYFGVKNYLREDTNRIIKKIGLVVIVLVSLPMIALTVSRFGDSEKGAGTSVISYAGQSTVNFAEYVFDNNGIRYGDRTVSLLKKIVGFDNVPENFLQRRAKYPHLRINDEVFSTYIGDFVLDFGPIITVVIFIFISLYLNQKIRMVSGKIYFHNFLLLHFIMCVCIQGISLFQYADTGNLTIIVYILFYWLLRLNTEVIYSSANAENKY